MTTLFYLFSNVFHIYATYQFSNVFLQKKKESAKSDIVLFTLYYIINSCAYLVFDNRLITILSNIIPFILIFLYYKVSLFKSLLSAFVLWVGDLTITFKPFSISLPGWYKPVGILLFFLSMAVYTTGDYTKGYKQGFDDGVKKCIEILKKNLGLRIHLEMAKRFQKKQISMV